jgi:hypothetical protein
VEQLQTLRFKFYATGVAFSFSPPPLLYYFPSVWFCFFFFPCRLIFCIVFRLHLSIRILLELKGCISKSDTELHHLHQLPYLSYHSLAFTTFATFTPPSHTFTIVSTVTTFTTPSSPSPPSPPSPP